MTKRILILMSKTGGGHRASAEALQAGFEQLYPNEYDVRIIDLLMDYLPWPVKKAPKSYDFLSSRTPWLWHLLYEASDDVLNALDTTAARALSRSVERAFREHQPDLVISVHPLAQHVSIRALKRLKMNVPFVTVITDLTSIHPAWFHHSVDRCFVPTETAEKLAVGRGLAKDKIRHFGLPLRPAFAKLPERGAALRSGLQMDHELPAVLVYGGGASYSKTLATVDALQLRLGSRPQPLGQIVVITGREGTLQTRLAARQWRVPVRAVGFVSNMHEWMAACDCIVTKAGPGTIAESMVCGLPIILNGYIPGQEAGNVPYVVNQGLGAYSEDPIAIARIVANWFGEEKAERLSIAARAREMSNPDATFHIVKEISKLVYAYRSNA